MKKFLKITGIVIGVILLLLFLLPFVFQGQIKDMVRKTINDNVNAQVSFEDLNLSLFRNFPDATLSIDEFLMINNAPFEGDTLASSEEVVLQMSVMELFKGGEEPMQIDALKLNSSFVNIKVDSLGNANYDVALEEEAPATTDTTAGSGFQFDVQHYEINDSRVNYFDEGAKISLIVADLNHEGTGDFSAETSTLETYSTALVSFGFDGTEYLNRNKVELDADFEMDLANMRFTFLENEARINQLPLRFDGYVQVNENNNELGISFNTPSSSFKNFLAVIPEEYSKNIENVETSGDFVLEGSINGIVDETHIPMMDISIASQNASFKYPDLPKAVQDISMDIQIMNETGLAEDTYVDINDVNFRIDEDAFNARGNIRNLTENMLVNLTAKGSINLANLTQAYPLELEQDLNGRLTADLTTSFDMNSLENEQYQNVKSSGRATITGFSYTSPEFPNPIELSTASINMQQETITLENLKASSGQTDLSATGSMQNLMGFLFTDQALKGRFDVKSDTFSVNDFMVAQEEEPTTEEEQPVETETPGSETEAIKIPSFLDVELTFSANRVLYDNLELRNASGSMRIANETASLNNVTSSLFGGTIALNGNVNTGQAVPTFQMDLNLQSIDIVQAFEDMELLRNLAPIAQALQGQLTTSIDLQGNLNNDLTPRLQTLAGNAMAEILGAKVNPEQTPLLSRLDSQLNFVSLDDLNLKDLETQLTFNNGQVEVRPFDFNIKGINATVGGSHGFDMDMNYQLTLDIPAKYLGSQVGNALSSLSEGELENTTVSLPVGITGTFQNPSLNLNMQQAVSSLTQEIIEKQKENLKDKGRDIISDVINRNRNDNAQDTTASAQDTIQDEEQSREEKVKNAAKDILGGILGGKKKKQDTTDQ